MIRFTWWCFVFWFDQAFYPTNKDVNVKYGDTIAARCMFTGENMTTATSIGWVNIPIKLLTIILALCEHFSDLHGLFLVVLYHLVCLYPSTLQPYFLFSCRSTSNDEMCNFYIMYYMDRKHAIPFMSCMDPGPKQLFQHIPAEANLPIPVSPDMMHSGHMMHSAHVSGTKIICWFCCRTRESSFDTLSCFMRILLFFFLKVIRTAPRLEQTQNNRIRVRVDLFQHCLTVVRAGKKSAQLDSFLSSAAWTGGSQPQLSYLYIHSSR